MTPPLLPPAPRIALGRLVDREAVWDTSYSPHLLICGDTGAGKTTCLVAVIRQLQATGVPVGVLDGKGGGDFAALNAPVVSGVVEIAQALSRLVEKTAWRHRAMRTGTRFSDRIFLVLDEWAAARLIRQAGESRKVGGERVELMDAALAALVTQGRSAGIHVILGIQRPDVQLLGSGLVRDNLRARIALGHLTEDGYSMVFPGHRVFPPRGLTPGRGYAVGLSQTLIRPEPIWIAAPPASSTEPEAAPSPSREMRTPELGAAS